MSLIPLRVLWKHSASPYNSKDGAEFVAADDGLDYVAKKNNAGKEAFCYWLAARLGLAVPASAWLVFDDGRIAFGSRWETGVTQYTLLDVEEREQALFECRTQIARYCLLDAFLANPDRHPDNLLLRRSHFDNRWQVINIDFSRALWDGGFPLKPVREAFVYGNTGAMARLMLALRAFETTMCTSLAAGLLAIDAETVHRVISEMPDAAKTPALAALPEWWGNQARLSRIDELTGLFR